MRPCPEEKAKRPMMSQKPEKKRAWESLSCRGGGKEKGRILWAKIRVKKAGRDQNVNPLPIVEAVSEEKKKHRMIRNLRKKTHGTGGS